MMANLGNAFQEFRQLVRDPDAIFVGVLNYVHKINTMLKTTTIHVAKQDLKALRQAIWVHAIGLSDFVPPAVVVAWP
jgi:hypothetical protein